MTVQNFSNTSPLGAIINGVDALNAFNQVVDAVGNWIQTIQTEETKRADITARERALLAQIAKDERVVLTYLDRSFDERAENFRQLFAALDLALHDQPGQVGDLLGAITALALKSPFSDLADRDLVMDRLQDKNTEWEV